MFEGAGSILALDFLFLYNPFIIHTPRSLHDFTFLHLILPLSPHLSVLPLLSACFLWIIYRIALCPIIMYPLHPVCIVSCLNYRYS